MIRRLPHVDRVGIEERAAQLGKRSIKTTAKQQGIRLAVSMLDLTTLEGADTPGKVAALCAKGQSVIDNIEQVERGYEDVDGRLRALGAKIERIS